MFDLTRQIFIFFLSLSLSLFFFFPLKNKVHSVMLTWASLVAQMVKRQPAMWETQVQSLGWEDLLEKAMAIHSSTLAWKIPWMEEPGKLQPM